MNNPEVIKALVAELWAEAKSLENGDDYSRGAAAARETIALRLESLTAVAGDAEAVELGELTPERIEHIAGAVAAAWCKSDMMVRAKRCQLAAAALRQLATRQAVEGMVPSLWLVTIRGPDGDLYREDTYKSEVDANIAANRFAGFDSKVTPYCIAAAAPQAGKGDK